MKISIYNRQKDLRLPIRDFKRMVGAFLISRQVRCAEVCVHFVSKKKIGMLHEQFFGDGSPTDCISLPIDPPSDDASHSILGEVFVCPKIAIEYAKARKKDTVRETLLYVFHGLLHLLGYDDLAEKDRKIMRREEKKAMALFAANK